MWAGGEAAKRRLEDEQKAEQQKEKKRLQLEKKEREAAAAAEREAGFSACEFGCSCGYVPCRVPVGFLEALPTVWAQEGPLQGGGMRHGAWAADAGLQSCCGRPVGGGSFLSTRGFGVDSEPCCLVVSLEVLGAIVVSFGLSGTDYMRRSTRHELVVGPYTHSQGGYYL